MIFSEEPAYLTSGACRIDPSLHQCAVLSAHLIERAVQIDNANRTIVKFSAIFKIAIVPERSIHSAVSSYFKMFYRGNFKSSGKIWLKKDCWWAGNGRLSVATHRVTTANAPFYRSQQEFSDIFEDFWNYLYQLYIITKIQIFQEEENLKRWNIILKMGIFQIETVEKIRFQG